MAKPLDFSDEERKVLRWALDTEIEACDRKRDIERRHGRVDFAALDAHEKLLKSARNKL